MKKLAMLILVGATASFAFAGSFIVSVRMPDQTILKFELASVPKPDADGLFHFHVKGRTNQLIVHPSNVWIEEKSKK